MNFKHFLYFIALEIFMDIFLQFFSILLIDIANQGSFFLQNFRMKVWKIVHCDMPACLSAAFTTGFKSGR